MNQLLGNLAATVIGGVVVMITLAMQIRAQELTADATVSYAAKGQSLGTAEWMHDDLVNVGWGVPAGDPTMEAPVYDAAGRTRRFAFFRKATKDSTEAAPDSMRFVYELRFQDSVRVADAWTRHYQVVRCQTPTAATGDCPAAARGGSSRRVSDFRIDLLGQDGAAASTDAARLVRLRFTSTVPLAENRPSTYLRRTFYATTLPLPER